MNVVIIDLLSRIDLLMIHRGFLDRVVDMLSACRAAGHDYRAVSGFRGPREQEALYAVGRSRPGKVVTNARAFQSAHNFGLAIDFAHANGAADASAYEVLGREALSRGLAWGGDCGLNGRTHVQMSGYVSPAQLQPLMRVYLAASEQDSFSRNPDLTGLAAVWSYLDENAAIHA